MATETGVLPTSESTVGGSFVSRRGVLLVSGYLVILCFALSYCLAALWPADPELAITSIKPDHGTVKGDTKVDLVGTGFSDGMQVFFGDVPANSVIRKSSNLIEVTTPPISSAGSVTIELDAPDGLKTRLNDGFRYDPEGQTASLPTPTANTKYRDSNDNEGPSRRRASFPLFSWADSISSSVRFLLITLIVGAMGSLIHGVRSLYWYVGNRNLKSSWLLMYWFIPFNGAGLALLFFLITRGFSSQPIAVQSSIDGYAALAAIVGMFSPQALLKLKQIAEGFLSPAEKGKDPAIAPPIPKIVSIAPKEGPSSGGSTVTISGDGFASVSRVTFGGILAPQMRIESDSQISVTVPAHLAGSVDVDVATPTALKASFLGGFTYIHPTLAAVSPKSGPAIGGTTVNITGNGFGDKALVTIGGNPATSIVVASSGSISSVTPAGAVGPADIQVTNPDGKFVILPGAFQFT
jgi:IPT/TIG domain